MSFHRRSLAGLLVLLVLLCAVPNVSGARINIVAVADSYTSSIDLGANYGGLGFLDCYNYTYEILGQTYSQAYVIWLKFDLSAIPSGATVNSIILRLHTSLIGPFATNNIGVFLCSNSNWQEITINWNNAPQVTGAPITTASVGTGDRDYDFDVTSAVRGQSTVTLVLKTLESTSLSGIATFYSREQVTSYPPRLVVDYSSPSSPSSLLDFVLGFLFFAVIVAVIVIAIAYLVMRRRRKQPPPTTTQTPT